MKSRSFQILISVTLLAGSAFFNAACSGETKQARIADLPSEDGGAPSPTPAPPPTTLEEDFKIYTTFAELQVKSYLHDKTSADWSKACSVSPSATTDALKYINCLLEVHELDLYFSGLSLNFNAPIGMCKYVEVVPYWHWRGTAGVGPTAVTIRKVGDAAPGIETETRAVNNGTIGATIVDGQLKCSADHTGENDGKNCCEGKYTLTTITDIPASGGSPASSSTAVSTGKWGGRVGDCAHGAVDDFKVPREKNSGIPGSNFYNSEFGVSADKTTVKITPVIDTVYENITHITNYFDDTNFTPPSMTRIVTYPNGYEVKPNRYYTYNCLDEAHDVRARIRLEVRRWTMVSELAAKGNHNRAGPEGGDRGDYLDHDSWETGPWSLFLLGW